MSLFLAILAFPYIGIFLHLNLVFPAFFVTVCIVIYGVCFFLKTKHIFSGLMMILVTCVSVLYCATVFGRNIGAQNFYFGFIAIAFSIFISKDKKILLLAISIPVLSMFFLEYNDFSLFTPVLISSASYKIITYFANITSFFIVLISVYSFHISEKKYRNTLLKRNKELELANYKLQAVVKRDAEYKLARQFQKRYLPELYAYKNIVPSVLHKPSSRMVSGDFYDIRVVDDEHIGYFLMDVGGKGLEASYVTIQLHTILRTKLIGLKDPKHVMQVINGEVQNLKTLKKMCAGVYLSFNSKTHVLSYSRAAIDILWVLRDGAIVDLDIGSPPLGFSEMHEFVTGVFNYQEGDIVIVSTDGILDALNSEHIRFGENKFRKFVLDYNDNDNVSFRDYLDNELKNYAKEEPLVDDITILIFEL